MTTWTNWAGTVTAHLSEVDEPATITELQQALCAAATKGARVKPIGAGHSFTAIGQTDGVQLRLDRLPGSPPALNGSRFLDVLPRGGLLLCGCHSVPPFVNYPLMSLRI